MDSGRQEADYNAAVAAVLRSERAARRLTYEQLAKESGITRVTLVRIFNDKRSITVAQLFKLAGPFKRTPDEIVRMAIQRLFAQQN